MAAKSQARVISGQPAWGKVDATAMVLRNEGALFVFNPTASSDATNNTSGLKVG
jgi:hypothetical protein